MKVWKSISFYTLLWLSTAYYFGLGMLYLIFWQKKEDVISWAASRWGKFNLKHAKITVDIVGLEHTCKRPVIFIYNHQSMLDLFIICTLVSYKTLPLAKKSFLYFPFMGWFMKSIGVVFVERHHPQKAMVSLKRSQKIIQEGYAVVMAPEGTRTKTGDLGLFKPGAFRLAIQTKLPLIPIIITNAYELFPKTAWFPKPGTVKVMVLPPLETHGWNVDHLNAKIEEIRNVYLTYL